MEIKPIETIYNGYKFRSRLEARWAVFFDALGIRYEYEKEGYQTQDGYYLPDFWLPETETYIEIKPLELDQNGNSKWVDYDLRWLHVAKDFRFVILCGTPGEVSPYMRNNPYEGYVVGDNSYYWTACPECWCIDINFDGRSARNHNHKSHCKANADGQDKGFNLDDERIVAAYGKARQARFEYREHGQ